MKHDLAFLHTARAHIDTFSGLIAELAPRLSVNHIVDKSLLHDALQAGEIGPELVQRIETRMREAASTGAHVVVCTCSTIGSIAENVNSDNCVAMRIDRAMADAAVNSGKNILLAATIESALAPTHTLLKSSAKKAGTSIRIRELLINDAWESFQSGDTTTYIDRIIKRVRSNSIGMGCVVLAQASMAPAADQCFDLGIPVFSSPRLGVKRALKELNP